MEVLTVQVPVLTLGGMAGSLKLGEKEMQMEAELLRRIKEEEALVASKRPNYVPPPSYTHARKHPLPENDAILYGKVCLTPCLAP